MTLSEKHELLALREFTRSDFRETRGDDRYLQVLKVREDRLSVKASHFWRNTSSKTLNDWLDEDLHIKSISGCTLSEKQGRYFFTGPSGQKHDISSDPSITSPARLKAHWQGFLHECGIEVPLSLGKILRKTLIERIRAAKKFALKEDGDFASGTGQVVAIDANGDRCTSDGSPSAYFTAVPALKVLHQIFEDEPRAVTLSVEGQTYYRGEGNAAEQTEHADPCDWWTVQVQR